MPMTQARAARTVTRAQLPFGEHVRDPRSRSSHSLAGILTTLVAAFSSLDHSLRDVEAFSKRLPNRTLRRLGLASPISDTTVYELLAKLRPDELRSVLWEQVRRDLDSKGIRNDAFARGVVTFDGKGAGSGMGHSSAPSCRNSVCDAAGTKCWDAFALRVCLTSSLARPILDQQFIHRKKSEASTFPEVFDRVCKQFQKLFRYVTWDAGLTSEVNARLVLAAGKHYVGAIKGNFNKLFPRAKTLLEHLSPCAVTEERAQGKHVCRELRRASIPEDVKFAGARELWGVRQTSTSETGKVVVDQRVFIVSVPPEELSDEARLALVRLHWGIENGPNWTADVVLREDTRTPCTAGEAVPVVGWLRALAYNLLSVFRAHLPARDRRPESWKQAARQYCDALLLYPFLVAIAERPVALA